MTDFLYMIPGATDARTDAQSVYEAHIDAPSWDYVNERRVSEPASWPIEKWTALPARDFMLSGADIAENVAEWASENMGTDDSWEHWSDPSKDPEVVAAFSAAAALMASKVNYWMCGELVEVLHITFTGDGDPLLNGELLYGSNEAVPEDSDAVR